MHLSLTKRLGPTARLIAMSLGRLGEQASREAPATACGVLSVSSVPRGAIRAARGKSVDRWCEET